MNDKATQGRWKPATSKKKDEYHPLAAELKKAVSTDVVFTLQKRHNVLLWHKEGIKKCQIRWYRVYHVLNKFQGVFFC